MLLLSLCYRLSIFLWIFFCQYFLPLLYLFAHFFPKNNIQEPISHTHNEPKHSYRQVHLQDKLISWNNHNRVHHPSCLLGNTLLSFLQMNIFLNIHGRLCSCPWINLNLCELMSFLRLLPLHYKEDRVHLSLLVQKQHKLHIPNYRLEPLLIQHTFDEDWYYT